MIKSAIAFVAGCVAVLQLAVLPDSIWLLPAIIILLLSLWLRQTLLICFTFAVLWTSLHSQLRLTDQLASHLQGQDLQITGVIASVPQREGRRLRFEFKPDQQIPVSKIRLNWYQIPDVVPAAGERWQLTVRLRQPFGMQNPGAFDYEGWLFREGIAATGYVRPDPANRRLETAARYSVNHLRMQIAERLQQLGNSELTPLLQGLSVGLRDQMTTEQWQILQKTGTSHLLAISGLHIGLAAGIGFFIGRWLWSLSSRRLLSVPAMHAGAVSAVLFALTYALLAGLSIPTQRALIMISVMMLSLLLGRAAFNLQTLALSMIIVTLIDPFSVLSAGFWLSYAAVFIIIFVARNHTPALKKQWLKIHLWVALGLSPLLMLFFQQTSLIAPLANLLAVPLVSLLVVPLLLLTIAMFAISESLAAQLLKLVLWLMDYLWRWLDWLAASPIATWEVPHLPLSIILLLCAASLLVLAPRGLPARWLGLTALLPLLFWQAERPADDEFWLTMLDVGQGLSVVIHTANHSLVFDTGPRFGSTFNTGDAAVLPYLDFRGTRKLDLLMISHGDNDHIGGAEAVLRQIPVKRILTGTEESLANAERCHAGQHWQWDEVLFEVLHPPKNWQAKSNEMSCVLKVSNRHGSVLLTGDIETRAETLLLQTQSDRLNATVLQVPHHGSRSSSSEAFIAAVAPEAAWIASAYRNRWQFPHEIVRQRYQDHGVELFNTADSGALLMRFDGQQQPPVRWRLHARRLWTADATE